MPVQNASVSINYIQQFINFPEYPDRNAVYFVEDTKQLFVGNKLIADHIDVDLSPYKVKDVSIIGEGNYVKSIALNEVTGVLEITYDTLPTVGKGVDTEKVAPQLQPGQEFTVVTDTTVSDNNISDENTKFTLPHQIADVEIEQGSVEGSVKITVESTDPDVPAKTSQAVIQIPSIYATKQYVDDAIAGISGGMTYLGVSTTEITDGGSEYPTIGGEVVTDLDNGDIVLYDGNQFIWNAATNTWNQSTSGDAYARKDIEINAGSGISGGGTLANNMTISHGNTGSGESGTVQADTTNLEVIDKVSYDEFGHVTSVTKSSIKEAVEQAASEACARWDVLEPEP